MNATKTLRLPGELHRRLKRAAARAGVTMPEFLRRLLTRPPIPSDDPVYQACINAPDDDEPFTDEERQAVTDARKEPSIGWND